MYQNFPSSPPSVTVTNVTALGTMNTTSMTSGARIWVATKRVNYQLDKTATSGDVAAAGGGYWQRLAEPVPDFLAATFWAIDPSGGSDENAGYGASQAAADLVPLATMDELNRRLFGSNFTATVTFHQLSNIATFTALSNVRTATSSVRLIWIGTKTNVFPGGSSYTSVTAYTAAVPASSTGPVMQLAALPTSWTASGLVGLMVEDQAETKGAWVQKDNGGKVARLLQPQNPTISTGNPGTIASFTAGDQVRVVSMTTIPAWPFSSAIRCYMGNNIVSAASAFLVSATPGPTSALFYGKWINVRAALTSGTLFTFAACQMATSVTLGGGTWAANSLGLLGVTLVLQGEGQFSVSHGYLDFQASNIQLTEASAFTQFGTDAYVAAFDCTATLIASTDAALGRPIRWNAACPFFGSGNSGKLISVQTGSASIPAAVNITVTTSDGTPYTYNTTSIAIGGVPAADANALASINFA